MAGISMSEILRARCGLLFKSQKPGSSREQNSIGTEGREVREEKPCRCRLLNESLAGRPNFCRKNLCDATQNLDVGQAARLPRGSHPAG